ncbi:MAG: M3 family oligoendopeptidase [Acidimicrobiales bacterium]
MTDTAAEAAVWDLDDLLRWDGPPDVDALLDEAMRRAVALEDRRGTVGGWNGPTLRAHMDDLAALEQIAGRASAFASLRYAADVTDAEAAAAMQKVTERLSELQTHLLWWDLEWAALDDERAAALLASDGLDQYRHHLAVSRNYRPHLRTEAEEQILTEKAVTGRHAWTRLFELQVSTITVDLGGESVGLEAALSRLALGDRDERRAAADAVTASLQPGLATRAFIYNTLLQDKAVDDRLRRFDNWIASRNLANEASDASVDALVDAVRRRYDVVQRWYGLKARLLGLDRLAYYDRMAPVTDADGSVSWLDAKDLVLDTYRGFSAELGGTAALFFDRRWIDVPVRPGKRPGAFCNYTVPDVHPYVLLNWTGRRRDVMTLAHELGHGLHAYLAAGQGPFQQHTPLTMAETASVFGETLVFGRMLERASSPSERLALLAESIEGAIATVFRQTAMNRFEHAAHTARRTEGELSADRFGELWVETQSEMMGKTVEVDDAIGSWWSYVPHFMAVPGYVYAYAYGQLLALSVYHQYEVQGSDFVPRYLHLLSAGASAPPEELGRIVGCDLADPAFWDGGIGLIEAQVDAAEQAAWDAGRLAG